MLPLDSHSPDVQMTSRCVVVVEGVQAALAARAGLSIDDIHVLHGAPSRLNKATVDPQFVNAVVDSLLHLGQERAATMMLVTALRDGILPSCDLGRPIDDARDDVEGSLALPDPNQIAFPTTCLSTQLSFARCLEAMAVRCDGAAR